jgi:uncharacterized protein (DUF58 family)
MLVRSPDPPPTSMRELLGDELLARLDRLDLSSRKVLRGRLPGERRSKRRGSSVEFDDFRPYAPGDDLRRIDWNAYARLDELLIKLFRADEDLSVRLVVDCSASMDAGSPTKRVTAVRLAMALAYAGVVNNNRVSISAFGRAGIERHAPVRGRRNIEPLGRFLLGLLTPPAPGAGEPSDFSSALRALAADRLAGRGVLIALSDLFVDEGLEAGLNAVASPLGYDPCVLQILAPEEQDPALARDAGLVGDLRLEDAEGRGARDVTISPALLRRYQARFAAHQERVRAACGARGILHVVVPTGEDPSRLVLDTLRRRGLLR